MSTDPAEIAKTLMFGVELRIIRARSLYAGAAEFAAIERSLLEAFRLLVAGGFALNMAIMLVYPYVRRIESERGGHESDNSDFRSLVAQTRAIAEGR